MLVNWCYFFDVCKNTPCFFFSKGKKVDIFVRKSLPKAEYKPTNPKDSIQRSPVLPTKLGSLGVNVGKYTIHWVFGNLNKVSIGYEWIWNRSLIHRNKPFNSLDTQRNKHVWASDVKNNMVSSFLISTKVWVNDCFSPTSTISMGEGYTIEIRLHSLPSFLNSYQVISHCVMVIQAVVALRVLAEGQHLKWGGEGGQKCCLVVVTCCCCCCCCFFLFWGYHNVSTHSHTVDGSEIPRPTTVWMFFETL